jgi:WD40 repeat protein
LTGGSPFEFAALSSDAKWCAAGQWKASTVRLFEVESGTTKTELPAERVSAASFSPDASWLVTGGFDDYSCWTGEPWRLVWRHRRDATGYLHPAMAFSPDSRMVAVGDSQVVRLFDVATGRPLATLESREPSLTAALAFNHDGTRLAVSGWDRFIQLWDLRRVREALAEMRLDWELPPFPPAASTEDHALAVAKQLSSSDRPKPTAAAQVSSPGPSK